MAFSSSNNSIRGYLARFSCMGGSTGVVVNPLPLPTENWTNDNSVPYVGVDLSQLVVTVKPQPVLVKDIDEIAEWTWKTTKPFVAPVSRGKCIKVYDGDTITVATRLPFDRTVNKALADTVFRFAVRLAGIDCPEIKGKTNTEKARALVARDVLKDKILDKHVILKNVMTEKYGRLLADVYVVENGREVWLNKWMLDNGHAVFYDGGTKKVPEDWTTEDQI